MPFNYLPAIDDVFRLLKPDRRQSKTLLTIDECGSNIARNNVSIFDLHSSIVLNFDLIICLIWFASLHPSQHSFIYVGTDLRGLN